jgi:hypothetical protein
MPPTDAPRNRVPRLHRCKAPSGLGSRNRGASAHGPTDAPRNRVPRLRRRKASSGLGSRNRGASAHDPTNAPRNRVPRLHRRKAPGVLGSRNRGASAHGKTDAPRNRVPRLHRCKAPVASVLGTGERALTTQPTHPGTEFRGYTDARLRGLGSRNRGLSTHDPTNTPRNRVPRLRRC